jgi:hypothetical protein
MDWQFLVGIGAAIIYGLMGSAVKDMPVPLTWAGLVAGVLLMVWAIPPLHSRIATVPGLLIVVFASGLVGSARWSFQIGSGTKEYDTPFVYAVPTMNNDKLQAIHVAIGTRGKARQHNVNFQFTALTKGTPMKVPGNVFAPLLDPGSASMNAEFDPGDYFIVMRADSGLFRESLHIEVTNEKVKQTIRILDDDNTEVFKAAWP